MNNIDGKLFKEISVYNIIKEMQKFDEMKLKEIFNSERESIIKKLKKQAIDDDTNLGQDKLKKMLDQSISTKSKTKDYVDANVFKLRSGDGYMVVEDELNNLKFYETTKFNNVLGKNTNTISKNLLLDMPSYSFTVSKDNFFIDREKRVINMRKKMNFTRKDIKLTKEEMKAVDECLDFFKTTVCQSDENTYRYFVLYLAIIFHEKKSNILLYLVGHGGIGKTTLINLFNAWLGQSTCEMTDEALQGKDIYNGFLEGKSLCFIPETMEANESNKKANANLKRWADGKKITIRKMKVDPYDTENLVNFVISTNYITTVIKDRRTIVLEFSSNKKEDSKYFANFEKTVTENTNVLQYLFNYFYDKFDEEFWKMEKPDTEVMHDLKNKVIPVGIQYLLDCYIVAKNTQNDLPKNVTISQMWEEFTKSGFCKHNHDGVRTIFASDIRQVLPKGKIIHKTNTYNISNEIVYNLLIHRKYITDEDIAERKAKYEKKAEADVDESNLFLHSNNQQLKETIKRQEFELQQQKEINDHQLTEMQKLINELNELKKAKNEELLKQIDKLKKENEKLMEDKNNESKLNSLNKMTEESFEKLKIAIDKIESMKNEYDDDKDLVNVDLFDQKQTKIEKVVINTDEIDIVDDSDDSDSDDDIIDDVFDVQAYVGSKIKL